MKINYGKTQPEDGVDIANDLLDTLLTPVMYWLFGRKPTERLLGEEAHTPPVADAHEAF